MVSLIPLPTGTDAAPRIVEVLLPVALDQTYSYRLPPGIEAGPGATVIVPFGPRRTHGVVWGHGEGSGANLKAVEAVAPLPLLSEALRRFLTRVAEYTLAPLGLVAKMAMRDPEAEAHEAPRTGVRVTGQAPSRPTPARLRVLAAATGGLAFAKRDLAERAGCSPGVIDGLVDDGALETVVLPAPGRVDPLVAEAPGPALGASQAEAVAALVGAVGRGFAPFLLDGVTGSGKTEVYFEAIAAALRAGRQALVLLPEISLTPEFVSRFEARFGGKPGLWHSGVSPSRRDRLWHAVAEGEARVVVGARSALFLPFAALGLIVVDEEHEAAFKQDDLVRYQARDMAVLRARIEDIPVVLASATPSIESRVNAARGRYRHLVLPDRAAGRAMPAIGTIDLRAAMPPKGKFLSPRVLAEAGSTLEAGGQVLFFLNRRGYAPLTLCRSCGHRWQCPNCDAWLVEHRFRWALVCHHCGHAERRPPVCTECGAEDSLTACGPGVERIAEEVAEAYPDARRIVLSSDFPGGTERLKREFAAVAAGEYRIIIGTQLLAKGHNFPELALVVVVDADLGLVSSDPRAAERSFQILTQVTGRAGRGDRPGRGLLQTHAPDHPVLVAIRSGDAATFYAEEIRLREAAGLPPFGGLASLTVSARERAAAEAHAQGLARAALPLRADPRFEDVTLLGPAEPPLALLRGKHRLRLLVRARRRAALQPFLRALVAGAGSAKGGARVDIDVDPVSFL